MRLFIEQIMGKAFSCCCRNDNKIQVETIDETSRLLTTAKFNGADSNGWHSITRPTLGSLTDLLDTSDSNVNNNSNDKTIERELSNKLIDITAIDQPIDRHEWEERMSLYEKRISHITKPLLLTSKVMSNNLSEESVSERQFNPIEVEDLQLITYLSQKASEAVLNGFQIRCDDSIVVSFNPWTRN